MHFIIMVWLFNNSTDRLFIATCFFIVACRDMGNAFHPGSNLFHTLMAFLKEFFKKVDFEKSQQHSKFPRPQVI